MRRLILFLLATGIACAVEKYWIVRNATLIVVGTMHGNHPFPWLDGWHYTGTIDVDEVIVGTRPKDPVAYKIVSDYAHTDVRLWPFNFPDHMKEKGLWCLRQNSDGTWRPAAWYGFVPLSERADYLSHIGR
jgi:hypothetical protein